MRGRAAAVGCALALLVAGCGADDEPTSTTPTTFYSDLSTGPATIDSPQLRRIYGYSQIKQAAKLLAEPDDGRRVVAAAGCLACHQIGTDGNSGPGNNLSGIGERRTPDEIRRAIVSPPQRNQPLMPAYGELPRRMLDALVAYLVSLRGGCSGDADCG